MYTLYAYYTLIMEEQKKGGGSKVLLIILVVVALLCVCCCAVVVGGTALTLGAASTAVSGALTASVCEENLIQDDADVASVYELRTTSNFKSDVTLEEFEGMLTTLQDDVCPDLTGQDVLTALQNGQGFNYSYENGQVELTVSGNFNGYNVLLEMRGSDEDLKIDRMVVEEL